MNFPIFNTKELSDGNTYDINDPAERHIYFRSKVGTEIDEIKEFLDNNTFVGFLLAKKSAGKGTYTKMMQEIFGSDRIAHISVGDVVRKVGKDIQDPSEYDALVEYLNENYRGFISVADALDAFTGRSQDKLIPTEFILALVKREIESVGRKALFIDGFPRSMDQISYSLYFRELINFRDDPDFFVLIDVPINVIDERMKYRRICPVCNTSRNLKLLPTKFVNYDKDSGEFYLVCDNPSCSEHSKARLVQKDGDDKGIELIKDRLETDGKLMEMAANLTGVPQIKLRNAIPVSEVADTVEDYELTPEYVFTLEKDKVVVTEKPWTIDDDEGIESNSLLAPPVVVSFIKQLHKILIG